jgi:RimJ/RimL family protein N-acetyltransferase
VTVSVILGKLVRLRAIEKTDLASCHRWFNDPEVTRYMLATYPISALAEEGWVDSAARSQSPTDRAFAIETHDGAHIGNIGLHRIDWIARHADAGIVIGEKEYWGRGYGTDAMRALLKLAFDAMNLHKVTLGVFEGNPRALRCYEKCGFRVIGTRVEHRFKEGRYLNEVMMEILRRDWAVTTGKDGAETAR